MVEHVEQRDHAWRRGAILKGNGLCHGVAGNGYAFLSLFAATGQELHRWRAEAFVALLRHAPLQEAMCRQPDPQRRVPGCPDSPASLMEGAAGVACFLLDAIAPEGAAFPGWE
ncbi:unnamed protein product [Prorocentrum cordatum]|uniref:Uncharacterized protein n=1 Tax=Prorocentrum cordatum TaxID=2364126 RepID=A0ABN9Q9Y3_9DINO|nr:unnamed protein product [Polarella glacialis]